MLDDNHERPNQPDPQEPRFIIPRLAPLMVMLGVFMTISVLSLFAILDREPSAHLDNEGGLKAYGPADFPDIAFDIQPPDTSGRTGRNATFTLPPPPFSDKDIFPCSDCHEDMDPNPTRRELEDFHEDIVLSHGPAERWCFDCHDPDDRDSLRLANGVKISFDESYRLCGQCHGTIFRDWREGIHGRRRGYWNGAKTYLLCAHCHNPHAPRFEAITPLPPRVRPEHLRQIEQGSEG